MSNENPHLLEEYKELGLNVRSDNDALLKLTAVFLPLAIAALALPYWKTGTPKLLAISGGVTLMTVWFLSSEITMERLGARLLRIFELEQILEFNSLIRYSGQPIVLKSQNLRRWMFGVYIVIALFVACDIEVETIGIEVQPTDTKVEATLGTIDIWTTPDLWPSKEWIVKLSITVETIVALITVAIVVGIWVWILKHDDKCPTPENKP